MKKPKKPKKSKTGTGNNAQFLSDTTGNRRWLPFEVENIVSPREQPFNYEGIYKQAYWLYQNGFQYWFSANELERLSRHNQSYETPTDEEDAVNTYFRRPTVNEQGMFMPVLRAKQYINTYATIPLNTTKMAQAFRKLGFKFKHTKAGNVYYVIQRKHAEVEQFLKEQGEVKGEGSEGSFW